MINFIDDGTPQHGRAKWIHDMFKAVQNNYDIENNKIYERMKLAGREYNYIKDNIAVIKNKNYNIKNLYAKIDKNSIKKVWVTTFDGVKLDSLDYNYFDFFKHEYYNDVDPNHYCDGFTLVPLPIFSMHEHIPLMSELHVHFELQNSNCVTNEEIVYDYYEKVNIGLGNDEYLIHKQRYHTINHNTKDYNVIKYQNHVVNALVVRYNHAPPVDQNFKLCLTGRSNQCVRYELILDYLVKTSTNNYLCVYRIHNKLNMSMVHEAKILNDVDNIIDFMFIETGIFRYIINEEIEISGWKFSD